MKLSHRFIVGVTAASLVFSPAVAWAADHVETPPTPATQDTPQFVKVMILAKGQPSRLGGELENLREVYALRDSLVSKYGIKADRSFGYLVKGFAAEIPVDKWQEIAAEPGVASVERTREYQPLMGGAGELTFSTQARRSFSITGEGVVIAVIDSGVDIHHRDMQLDEGVKTKLEAEPGFTAKVPWGYNYADDNHEVNDLTSSQHGMHVAGIAAGNGGKEANHLTNGHITGIAPNAQVLALKVFPNSEYKAGGAGTEDIIAAVEDAVKHGADIINMSLGVDNGHSAPTEAEQRAIRMASQAGVEVVVAAGNSGLNWDSRKETGDEMGLFDDGPLSAPGTSPDVLTVASAENGNMTMYQASIKVQDREEIIGYDLQVGTPDGQPHKLIDGGLGKDGEIPAEAKDNYVYIRHGEISFNVKFRNAVEAGALGVLVGNKQGEPEETTGMYGAVQHGIFGVMVTPSTALKIEEMLATGETTVTFTDGLIDIPVARASQPSNFSSWGTASSLDFAPHVSGIGGKVWSTLGGDKYGLQSGTSMAAPHVAGALALMLEKTRQDYPDYSASELKEYNRIRLANTSTVMRSEDGTPFSPRQTGAGLINTKAALETEVIATVDGQPWVTLKEVTPGETFTVTLENKGSTERTYSTGASCVVNESNARGEKTTTTCNAAESLTASAATVTVPAGGTAEVTYTVTTDPSTTHWLGAWAELTSEGAPTLVIPALGFVGDWNAEAIFDAPAGNPSLVEEVLEEELVPQARTSLASSYMGEIWDNSTGGDFWISPNNDGVRDEVAPALLLLRNAYDIKGSIHSQDGTKLRQLGTQMYAARPIFEDFGSPHFEAQRFDSLAFDGRLYNTKKGSFEPLANGKYIYRVEARLSQEFAPQTYEMTFNVDLDVPEVRIERTKLDDDGMRFTIHATDKDSGIQTVFMPVPLPGVDNPYLDAEDKGNGVWEIVLNAEQLAAAGVAPIQVMDNAGNTASQEFFVSNDPVHIVEMDAWNEPVIGVDSASDVYSEEVVIDGMRRFNGQVAEGVTRLTVNGEEVEIVDGVFDTKLPVVNNETNTYDIVAEREGQEPWKKTLSFFFDAQPPQVTVDGITHHEDSGMFAMERPEDGKLVLSGTATDNRAELTEVSVYALTHDGELTWELTGGRWNGELEIGENVGLVIISANDGVNSGSAIIRISNAKFEPELLMTPQPPVGSPLLLSPDHPNVSKENGQYLLEWTGMFFSLPSVFQIDGKDVEFNRENGEFAVKIPVNQGVTEPNILIKDKDGNIVFDTSMFIVFDSKLPTLTLEEGKPAINSDGAIYLKEAGKVPFAGTVSDNTFGWVLAFNGDVLDQIFRLAKAAEGELTRPFTHELPAEDGDVLLMALYDQSTNYIEHYLPIVVDGEQPTLDIDGLKAHDVLKVESEDAKATQTVKVRTTDANLAGLRVTLDGQTVEHRVVKVVSHPQAKTVLHGEDTQGVLHVDPNADTSGTQAQAASAAGTQAQPTSTGQAEAHVQSAAATDAHSQSGAEGATEMSPEATLAAIEEHAAQRAEAARSGADEAAATEQKPETELEVTVEVEAVVGDHTLVAEAQDKADNVAVSVVPFSVVVEKKPQNEAVLKTTSAHTALASVAGQGYATAGDTFTITAEVVDGVSVFAARSAPLTFNTQYTVTSPQEVTGIRVLGADGRVMSVTLKKTDTGYVFTAPSNTVIRVFTQAPGNSTQPGAGGAGSSDEQPTQTKQNPKKGSSGKLASTGSTAHMLLTVNVVLAAGGASVLAMRARRR